MKRVNVVVACASSALIIASACSVFEPPILDGIGSGGSGQSGNENGGSGPGSGGGTAAGGDASVGGTSSGGAGGEQASGGAASGGVSVEAGTGGAPSTEPFWIIQNEHGCEVPRRPTYDDRPAQSDPGPDLDPIVFAIYRARHGSTADDVELSPDFNSWQTIGFDMDGKCTNSSSCEQPNQEPLVETRCKLGAAVPFDGLGCIDNAVGKIFNIGATTETVGQYFGLTEQDWNCELHRGGFTTIIKISNYNGKLNDRDVRVDQYVSVGLQIPQNWTCRDTIDAPLEPNWWTHAPWLNTRHWKIARRSIDPADESTGDHLPNAIVSDSVAFVRNGYLVAKFPEASEFWWNGENTPVPGFRDVMRNPISVAKIVRKQDLTWELEDGILASVVKPGDMVLGFKEMGFCENMCSAFDQLKNYFNNAQDVLTDLSQDLPNTPCDALTIAIEFQARQATADRGDIVDVREPIECPEPRHPKAPRHGCTCVNGRCETPDGG